MSFAVVDPLMTGFRSGWRSAAVDALMYGEIAVDHHLRHRGHQDRRPPPPPHRPQEPRLERHQRGAVLLLGARSSTASVAATATYLDFVRSPGTARPWITLGVGTLPTGFVSYERVRSGAHFPTDVVAGSMAGAAIGVL